MMIARHIIILASPSSVSEAKGLVSSTGIAADGCGLGLEIDQ
jgi:hypothetical protein